MMACKDIKRGDEFDDGNFFKWRQHNPRLG
jgi:hypothetical protein